MPAQEPNNCFPASMKRKSTEGKKKDTKKTKKAVETAGGDPAEGEGIIPGSKVAVEQFKLWLLSAQLCFVFLFIVEYLAAL